MWGLATLCKCLRVRDNGGQHTTPATSSFARDRGVSHDALPEAVCSGIHTVCEPNLGDLGTWTVGATSADKIQGVAEFIR